MGLVGLAAIPRPDLPYALMVLMLLVIEAGSELTPDTGSIMARIPARDREWDPVDAAEQRGTSERRARLAIITSPLVAPPRRPPTPGRRPPFPGTRWTRSPPAAARRCWSSAR
jgi:hypothetical protein